MILALDMSTKSTGYAVFNDKKKIITFGCLTETKKDTLERIKSMTNQIKQIIIEHNITQIVAEEVVPDFGSRVYKPLLYLQCHLEYYIHDNHLPIKITYLMPNAWRAKLSIPIRLDRAELKQLDMKFVEDKYHYGITNDDIADAICIGEAYLS